MIWVAGGALLILLIGLMVTIVLLSSSKYSQGKSDTESEALKRGREQRSKADEIMAEPVADERAWLDRVRKRHLDD